MNKAFLKSIIIPLVLALTMSVACSTGPKEEPTTTITTEEYTMNPEETLNSLLSMQLFEDELAPVESSFSEMLMNITASDYKTALIYMGSGATAERLAIFEAADSDAAKTLTQKCNDHVQEQITAYADYMPKEVDKLEHALVLSKGNYVILCVAGNYEEAEKAIQKLLE